MSSKDLFYRHFQSGNVYCHIFDDGHLLLNQLGHEIEIPSRRKVEQLLKEITKTYGEYDEFKKEREVSE